MNRIFAFWESSDQKIPGYLELCVQTWFKNIPNVQVNIINYSNLHEYIGDIYDLDKLKKISLPMQSDIISAAVLERFGGLFIDLDCIITENLFDFLSDFPKDRLIGFGYPRKSIHLAVLFAGSPNNIILKRWRETAQERLNNLPAHYQWDFFGNSIINPLISNDYYRDKFLILDRTESGNILESKVFLNSTWKNSKEYYENFYFNPYFLYKKNVLDFVQFGVISLHNSWTPKLVKQIYDFNDFYNLNLPICTILKDVLSGHYASNKNNIFFLKEWILCKLDDEYGSIFSFRVINNILIIDFVLGGVDFAFDLTVTKNTIYLDFLVRENVDYLDKIKSSDIFKDFKFSGNKTRLLIGVENKKSVLQKLSSIYASLKLLS